MSVDHGAPPIIPTDLLPYESYTEDPKWQIRFTAMWCAALGLGILLAAPRAFRLQNLQQTALLGVRVRGEYEEVPTQEPDTKLEPKTLEEEKGSPLKTMGRLLDSIRLWSLPGIPLNVGQMVVVAGYAVFALVCIILQVPLMENPNRAGFIALAQLPPVFLFASKNSPLTALLLGPGVDYTKLNYIHRWAGRFLFLGAMVHGALWINNHVIFDLPILTQQKESSGVAALATLCIIVLTSVAPVRRWCYSAFLVIHFLTFPAFFVTICYHTIYATPWIFPPIAFYAADVFLRVVRWRVVVGRVEGKDGGMSLIHIPLARTGWRAGQHVQMRALIGGRAWEAHPLSVCCADPAVSCLRAPDGGPIGMLLAARVCGDWSRALHEFSRTPVDADVDTADAEADLEAGEGEGHNEIVHEKREAPAPIRTEDDEDELPGREAHLMLEGPYGGPTLRVGDFERVLLFAGGSGVTFTLGVLDELVGRCVRLGRRDGEKTRRVVWCWCVRSFGAISWFAPHLLQIATLAARPEAQLDLRIRIFVTCLCDPTAVPRIPGCTVTEARPSVGQVLDRLLDPVAAPGADCCGDLGPIKGRDSTSGASSASASTDELRDADLEKGGQEPGEVSGRGGVAVFAAGPGSLIREAGNAVALANLGKGRAAGGVAFNAEVFTI
ncbi:iron reductase [Mycena albidolilacea]|uniref:Iron reductase n=1 Tax=Mycena albidolilacea TaxID=1033008 RepID=A0AAD7F1P0_9AGAR|nr:iron reductase [Mycena albidolilacea]